MKEVIIFMATMMPEDSMLNELREAIDEHLIYNSEETKKRVNTLCMMFTIKCSTHGEVDKAVDMIKSIEKNERTSEIFNPTKN